MWLPSNIIESVDKVAQVYYLDRKFCTKWNDQRRDGELRLLTGWCWSSGNRERLGFKTITIAYRDAWYELLSQRSAPAARRPALRIVR